MKIHILVKPIVFLSSMKMELMLFTKGSKRDSFKVRLGDIVYPQTMLGT
jgi:hypothetical protein